MTDDTQPEDPAGALDLSAWQPPDPPVGFADGVVSRARVPDHLPLVAARSVPVVAVAALVVAVLALVGEVTLHGARLFVGDEDARADIAKLDTQVQVLDEEVKELQERPIAVQPVTVPTPTPTPVPRTPRAPPPQPVEAPRRAPGLDLPSPTPPGETGTLVVNCKPPAAIVFIDGHEVGVVPWRGQVTTGPHRVTYALGEDRYTFKVTIKAGETVTLARDFGPS